ncbi:MAG: sensor histidine kinase [Aggregatilineales bacterium]
MSVPNQINFAQEVRSGRLDVLWKVTLGLALLLVWGTLILTALAAGSLVDIILPLIATVLGCLACHSLLMRNQFEPAVWAYAVGLFITLAFLTYSPVGTSAASATPGPLPLNAHDLVPFFFPMVIFIVGLLLPFRASVVALLISIALTIVVPMTTRGFGIGTIQAFAIGTMVLATGVAAQMSGELYGIAEWALANYRKEREVSGRLYDSQQEIQRSFLRQQALTEQVQNTNQELEVARAAALEAKNFRGQFLANMSHELRTPLNAIIGFSEAMVNYPMMYGNQPLPPSYRQDLDQINSSGKQLLALINDILDLSKVDAGKLDLEMEKVDPDEMIKYVLAQASGLKGNKPVKLRRDTPARLPYVHGDSLRIRQVMLNLLSNAAKFTDQGSITVGAREQDDGTLLFSVTDTGIGIAPQDMDKIFEEFRQGTSGRRKGRAGSGLGLAIARQLLNLMGGTIWAESKLGEGSTFYFTLPLYVEEVQPAAQGTPQN